MAASLPTTRRVLVLSWYGTSPARSGNADVVRSVLLTTAHTSVALDAALDGDHLRAAVATRQLIGEAVGALAVHNGLSREEAFAALVAQSQRTHRKLRDVAKASADQMI